MLGKKREAFVTSVDLKSDNYETAERKVRLEVTCFVADVKVRPSP
jgi:predicted membrane protein